MALRVTAEERAEIKDEFLFDNEKHIFAYSQNIIKYCQSKILISEKSLIAETIGGDIHRIEKIAGDILFILTTTEPGAIPLQSLAGQLVGIVAQNDSMENRSKAMLVSMELLMMSEPYAKFTISKSGYYMIETMISNKKIITRNIALPLERPTLQHKKLGSYEWELSDSTVALDELNHMPMTIIPIEDAEPEQPTGNMYSKSYLKQQELHNKWKVRNLLVPKYSNKKIYFNWAADYRCRMYPVGYYFNPQGNELEKNMIGFYRGEKLDFRGVVQLKKSIASAYGLDKENDAKKLEWFRTNEKVLHLRKISAKEPHTFGALHMAWKQYLKGEEIQIPVEIDATNSQAQIMAVLLKSKAIAETCNVVNTYDENGEIEIADLYQLVADEMSDILATKTI